MTYILAAEQCTIIRRDIELILEHSRAQRPTSKDPETTLALLDTVDALRNMVTDHASAILVEQVKVRALTRELAEEQFNVRVLTEQLTAAKFQNKS